MRIYSNIFDLAKPIAKQFYTPPNSIFGFGIKIVKNGIEETDYTITVQKDGVSLQPMEATIDGFIIYQKTSESVPTTTVYDVIYEKGEKTQIFKLIDTTTDSTVFDVDQAGGVMDLPIATESVLGGIKVGENLTIEADGTLNADDQTITYEAGEGIDITDETISIDETVALKEEIPTNVSELINDANYIKPNAQGVVTVTGVNAQNVTVNTKLTVNAPAEIGYANLVESGSSKRYDAWLVDSDDSKVKEALASAGKVKTVNGIEPDDDGNIEIESGSSYRLINGEWTFNQEEGVYEYFVENNTVVDLRIDQNLISYRVRLPARPTDGTVRDCIMRFEVV